ncbi:hypothetical protein ABZX98_18980 [Streptomyces sp. NPDC002992]|uniref:hypothetical protein n=1 Tax=Streptomyces sp. NPDC002992 TaxID=3154273 RepID=UPI0033AB12A7
MIRTNTGGGHTRAAGAGGAVRVLGVVATLALLTACGGFAGSTRPCTLIGSPAGIRVELAPERADRATGARLTICWDDVCHQRTLRLRTEAPPGDPVMTTESAAADHTPEPAKSIGLPGFAVVTGLPQKPVRVTLVLTDRHGKALLDRQITLTPKPTHPNGPSCSPGGPQAGLTVTRDGSLLPV